MPKVNPNIYLKQTEDLYEPFSEIYHTAHISESIQILKDEKIKNNLVFDHSCLNATRILVGWFSPKDWIDQDDIKNKPFKKAHLGYRYGNVRFSFDFKKIVKNFKKSYWIETVEYKIPAPRILLTNNDYDFQLYDKFTPNGSWYVDSEGNNNHLANTCLEFLIDSSIELEDYLSKIDYVKHHPNMCSVNELYTDCKSLKFDSFISSSHFFSKGISMDVDFKKYRDKIDKGFLEKGKKSIKGMCGKTKFVGEFTQSSPESDTLIDAFISAGANNKSTNALQLAALFKNFNAFDAALSNYLTKNL